MAHGIQVRMPFTDWRLVTFGFALPESSKYGAGYTKRVLRLALDGRMPDEIRLRTVKVPFVSPMDDWVRGALKPWLLDLCASRAFLNSPVWNGPAVKIAVEQAVLGQTSIWPIWPILNAYALEQSFKLRAQGTLSGRANPNPTD
jgi:asparagine synthase (glutamine-hydrolysing)